MRRRRVRMGIRVCLTTGLLLAGVLPVALADTGWVGLRGPGFEGAARDARLFGDGDAALTLGWKQAIGSGYSGLSVVDGRVIAMFTSGEDDVIAAFDANGGQELWRYRIAEKYAGHDGSHDGPISTPLVDGGRIYGLAPRGELFALDAANGKPVWTKHLVNDFQAVKPWYGFSTSPLMADGVLIVLIGAHETGRSFAGLDPADGSLLWAHGDDEIHYHSPIVATLGGRKQVVAAGSKTIEGLDPKTGEVLWSHAHQGDDRAMGGATIIPVPAGEDRLFLMNKIDASTMIAVRHADDAWSVEELWSSNGIKQSYVIPVYRDGFLYGMNNRILTCVDAGNGETRWRSREPGDGFPILVGDRLVIVTKAGGVHVVEATPEAYREVAAFDAFEENAWSTAVYAEGTLFARSLGTLIRLDPSSSTPEPETTDWVADTAFGRFLAEARASDDPQAAVDRYMAQQTSFPIVESSGAVHFVYRGEADDVGIVGDMIGNRREDPLHRLPGTDLFHYSMRLEPDAAVTYGFIVDYAEEASPDPLNPAPASGLHGDISWLAMPAWSAPEHLDEAPEARRGRLETVEWESAAREGQSRSARVYLPAGYDAQSDRRYPVAYVFDGQAALDDGAMDRILDNLIDRSIEPILAVFVVPDPENPRSDMRDMETFRAMIANELVPMIDERYRTIPEREARAAIGTGAAAGGALEIAFTHSELFGRAGGQSALIEAAEVGTTLEASGHPSMVLYLDWGTYHMRSPHEAWDMAEENRNAWRLLREQGYRPAGGEVPEGFGWAFWPAHADEMLRALFPPRKG